MLENLDKIYWKRLSTSYGSAVDAPRFIRMFLSSDKKAREDAFEYMIGSVNHQGHIHDSTAAVTPFLIELLANPQTPEREKILEVLYEFATSVNDVAHYISSAAGLSTIAQLYTNLQAGTHIYELFLTHPDKDIREVSALFLALMKSNTPRTRLRLWHAFKQEKHAYIQVELIRCLLASMPDDWNPDKRLFKKYRDCFQGLIKSNSKSNANGMLAAGWMHCQLLITQFTNRFGTVPDIVLDALVKYLDDYTMPYLLRLDEKVLLEVFSKANLRATDLHTIARHLMGQRFQAINLVSTLIYAPRNRIEAWDFFIADKSYRRNDMIYGFEIYEYARRNNLDFQRAVPDTDNRRQLLKAIVERDRFWELPTNLFSFFFGLPDDREELRKLIE